jgi:hypothetical protein
MSHDLKHLLRPFPASAVNFRPADSKPNRNGSVRVLTYIDATDVRRRLNEFDPDWSFAIDGPAHWRHGIVEVRGTLTIGGSSRSDYGAAEVNRPRNFDGDPQEKDLHAVKSATSDALKRCATMFGIGDYLREMGQMFTDKPRLYNGFVQGIEKDGVADLKAQYTRIISHERFVERYGEASL